MSATLPWIAHGSVRFILARAVFPLRRVLALRLSDDTAHFQCRLTSAGT